jgi:hypothetical protein
MFQNQQNQKESVVQGIAIWKNLLTFAKIIIA